MGKFIDITGEVFTTWRVNRYLGNGLWECQCTQCGRIHNYTSYKLRKGYATKCSHTNPKTFQDLTNKTFGDLTAIKYLGDRHWLCRCSCGREIVKHTQSLTRDGGSHCEHKELRHQDFTGMTFDEWTVLRKLDDGKYWCRCSCGTERAVDARYLRDGRSKSCGCKKQKHTEITFNEKYGTKFAAQIHSDRTLEQITIVESKENLERFLRENYTSPPTTYELVQELGITRHMVLLYIHKYGLEKLVNLNPDKTSGYEGETAKIFPGGLQRDRTILNGRELDVYYPDKQLAIEFNGDFWHSTRVISDKRYHQAKTLACLEKSIRLIHIFEYEWLNDEKKQKIISLLDKELNPNTNLVIHARKCVVKDIEPSVALDFCNKYHLQNGIKTPINIGIFHNNDLVGVMTIAKPRFDTSFEFELIRVAFKAKTVVVGGLQRMFHYFVKGFNPQSIVSYCDLAKFNGSGYKKLGFVVDKITEPNYIWRDLHNDQNIVSRYNSQKHKLIANGIGKEEETEDEIMSRLGYIKIYDSGNLKFIWRSTN